MKNTLPDISMTRRSAGNHLCHHVYQSLSSVNENKNKNKKMKQRKKKKYRTSRKKSQSGRKMSKNKHTRRKYTRYRGFDSGNIVCIKM
jgi:hypothetical protein